MRNLEQKTHLKILNIFCSGKNLNSQNLKVILIKLCYVKVLLDLVRSPSTDIQIANISEQILQTIVENGYLSQHETITGRQVFASC